MTYTENRTQVFDHMTTTAQAGDYFRLPQQPIHRVLAAVDFGDYVGYIVQAGENPPEQWDVMKYSVELEEQERNRLQAEFEADEAEMSAIIYDASEQKILELLGLATKTPERIDWLEGDEWLTQLIGTNPDSIFGAEKLVVCHQCQGHGCGDCGYGGLKPEQRVTYDFTPVPTDDAFRFQKSEYGYQVLLNNKPLGCIQKIRSEEFWENTPESYYWVIQGNNQRFSSPFVAAQSLRSEDN